MTVRSTVHDTLNDTQQGKNIFAQVVSEEYTGTVGDAFVAAERLRLANQGLIKKNISTLLDKFSHACAGRRAGEPDPHGQRADRGQLDKTRDFFLHQIGAFHRQEMRGAGHLDEPCVAVATGEGATFAFRRGGVFDARMIPTVPPLYCPSADPKDPFLSPYRGDVAGLPPTLFHCSCDELLRDDSIRMAEKMKAAGVDTTIEIWPGVFHVWHITADILPEAQQAVAKLVAFLRTKLAR